MSIFKSFTEKDAQTEYKVIQWYTQEAADNFPDLKNVTI